jgi:predicted RNA binding protein YcfA (HicA-like mRNA interferase family)
MTSAAAVVGYFQLLEADGWFLCATRGDHRQYKHATKKGKVTVSGQLNKEMDQRNLNSIWHQAGWK